MTKFELNKYAITLVEKAFLEQGYKIEESSLPAVQVNFIAVSISSKKIKVKVKAITNNSSYIFVKKEHFNINDPELYMAVVYIPGMKSEEIIYLVPATEWGKDIKPFIGNDYNKPGLTSPPEWGINFSNKAKDAMESYRFSLMA